METANINRTTAALQAAQESEVMVKRPSFWALADDLQTYLETMSMVEAQLAEAQGDDRPLLVAEQAEIQQRIEQLGAELVTKTDSLAGVLRRIPRDIAEYKAERDRYAAKANAAERGLKWLKGYVADVFRQHGWKHLKTERNTVALRGNGGLQPMEITDAPSIPLQYFRMEGWIRADVWEKMLQAAPPLHVLYGSAILYRLEMVPDNGLIREALKSAEVPGANLLPRGELIEVR